MWLSLSVRQMCMPKEIKARTTRGIATSMLTRSYGFGAAGQIVEDCFGTAARQEFDADVSADPQCRRCDCRQYSRPGTLVASSPQPATIRRLAPTTASESSAQASGAPARPRLGADTIVDL